MLRSMSRVGLLVGLVVFVLVIAGGVLATPATRAEVAFTNDLAQAPALVHSTPTFPIALSPVGPGGLSNPVDIANAGDGSGRLFVVEQPGYIRIIKNGVLLSTPYLTLTGKVSCCGERGLLDVAFDPDFRVNGIFYVYYTAVNGDVTIERYVTSNPASNVANIISSTPILVVSHPAVNHNGGQLQFGPDGYLYTGLGDGGGAGDQHGPIGNGQNPAVLLGKLLRLNVRGVPTYTIPASNPFTQTAGYRPEIWALGLRNPWRFSFDRSTRDLYIGDVGQDCFEEIDYQSAASHGGENYGWRLMEGFHQFDPAHMTDCNQPVITPAGITRPITEYEHPTGEAVTGGYVYRGSLYPWLAGWYFYGDYGTGRIWAIAQTQPGVWSGAQKLSAGFTVSTFGEDENGELYVADYGQGGIYKITSSAPVNFSASSKYASVAWAKAGNTVTYTIVVRNTGALQNGTVRVTDTIPAGLSYIAGSLKATSGTIDDSAAPVLKWQGVMSATSAVTLSLAVSVITQQPSAIVNTATIDPGAGTPLTRSALIIANPHNSFQPLILRYH